MRVEFGAQSEQATTKQAPTSGTVAGIILATALVMGSGCVAKLPPPPLWQSTTLEKCQKAVESEASKFGKKVFGTLKKCADLHRAAVVDGDLLINPALKCDAALGKVLLFPDGSGKSTAAKAKAKLDKLTDPTKLKCSDADLLALGHLPTATFGDTWARLLLLRQIKDAVEAQTYNVREMLTVFTQLGPEGCPHCSDLARPLCHRSSCRLATGSSASSSLLPGTAPMSGSWPLDVCQHTGLLGSDFAVFSGPSKSIDISVTGIPGQTQAYCPLIVGGGGYIAGAGSSRPKVNVSACQDHSTADSDECPATLGAGTICSAALPDSEGAHGGVENGGTCINMSSAGGAAPGDAVLLVGVRSQVVGSGEAGPDAVACTSDDDPATIGPTLPIGVTTGMATATVLDRNAGAMTLSDSAAGATFDPTSIEGGDLGGGHLVGAMTGLDAAYSSAPPFEDTVVTFDVVCE